jgi:mitochondrial distribution and morphology protein 31
VFESAIVPKWKDGVISFKKVFVSRRPGQGRANVSKGSAASAAAAAAIAAAERGEADEDEDTNYTQFDVSIDSVNVTLSFNKWWNGKGFLRDVEIKGVRGVIDRTSVRPLDVPVDPKSYRHKHHTGDFELDSFKMEDLLVTIYQPNNFRPFSVSVYSCDLPKLRQQWLFYDFMSANNMSGSFDNSLFTIHPRQTHNYTGMQLQEGRETDGPSQWKKHSRIRVDGLNIDHLNRGVEGPFSWIHEGNVDIVADIMLPNEDEGSFAQIMSDFYDRVEATVTSSGIPNAISTTKPAFGHADELKEAMPLQEISTEDSHLRTERDQVPNDERFIVMDLGVHLNDVRAAVPLFTNDISYINNALIRPIVAYINSRKTFIPVNCRIVKRLSDFDGSWTIFDSGLMDDLSCEVSALSYLDILISSIQAKDINQICRCTMPLLAM